MTTFTIVCKDGNRSRIEGIEVEELGPEELAAARDLCEEMLSHLERTARLQAIRRDIKARDA